MPPSLQPYRPRLFLSPDCDLTSISSLEPILKKLQDQLSHAQTLSELESWFDFYSEVFSALDQVRTERYIAMTCDTSNTEAERLYLHFVEVIDPWLKPIHFQIKKQLTLHPLFSKLPPYYAVFTRSVQNAIRLFHPDNVPREAEIAKLSQKYQKIIGSITATFEGQELTLPQLSRILEEPDRSRRQASWEAASKARLQYADELETLFDSMLTLRKAIAHTAQFSDFRDYTFAAYERFDYTPQECLQFHDAIEKHFVPLARSLQAERQAALRLPSLRPWDLAVDPHSRPPIRPFHDTEELKQKTLRLFQKLDPRLAEFFQLLLTHSLTDLDNRKGKAPGGYQSTLEEARLPFIFMNAVGTQRDVETLLHEAGHAFHTLASRHQRLYPYRSAPIEFCEVASMSMELIALTHAEDFYATTEDFLRARRDHLEGIIKFFPWMATVDAFQHWIYTHPEHTVKERRQAWLTLLDRFGGIEDYTGYEEARATTWHRQLHIFEYPFYYVEYGIAQLGALQLWKHYLESPRDALDSYLYALSLGGSVPLPQLFNACGLRLDFSATAVIPVVETLKKTLSSFANPCLS
ncbi:MAG: M3 family oligoendopeptidase [Methylacidiphilales bacterium]|nr:M3 family oligoendopeptidase [Candidatus Methylacidiphilales bacterium]MDW8349000.1 M3 family oligoendopeptidase [Verrucomicrobiae bacterium]